MNHENHDKTDRASRNAKRYQTQPKDSHQFHMALLRLLSIFIALLSAGAVRPERLQQESFVQGDFAPFCVFQGSGISVLWWQFLFSTIFFFTRNQLQVENPRKKTATPSLREHPEFDLRWEEVQTNKEMSAVTLTASCTSRPSRRGAICGCKWTLLGGEQSGWPSGIKYVIAKQACSDHCNVKSQLSEGSASTLVLKKPKKLE